MTRGEAFLLRAATAVVVGSGLVYLAMRELLEPADEFAVVNHPWQPHVQHLHVLVGPILVFAVALVWRRHVVAGLRNGTGRRRTGMILAASFVPMVVSGSLVQVTVSVGWRAVWSWTHITASLVFAAAAAVHLMRRRPTSGNGGNGRAGSGAPSR